MKHKSLLIISDTRIQQLKGRNLAFNAVVKELDVFVKLFEEITWIGFDYNDLAQDHILLEIKYEQVKVVNLPRAGGKDILSKIRIICLLPVYMYHIGRHIVGKDWIHSRGPSVPMLIAQVFSFLYRKPRWWFKYATNWENPSASFFRRLQKQLLIANQNCLGTINGNWADLPKHIVSFENPCLDEGDILKGQPVCASKRFDRGFNLLFIGRLEAEKGIPELLEALQGLTAHHILQIDFIGDGPMRQNILDASKQIPFPINCHGILGKEKVYEMLANAHFLLLPSRTEGFPKVVAEALCYGCLPVVSDVGSIPQYIDQDNGFIWKRNGQQSYSEILFEAVHTPPSVLKDKAITGHNQSHIFSYNAYFNRLSGIINGLKKSVN
jgi:glycosyltransferase involved in cell wall biosynthesis